MQGLNQVSVTLDAVRDYSAVVPLLSVNSDAKTTKGQEIGYLTGVCYLSPAGEFSNLTGISAPSLCPFATAGCSSACLGNTAGRMAMQGPTRARLARTYLWHFEREEFLRRLRAEIAGLAYRAKVAGMIPAVRLNGASDILWERFAGDIMRAFPQVRFYDYTKIPIGHRAKGLPANYHLTVSRGETAASERNALSALVGGFNAAVVFDTKPGQPLPAAWHGFPVLDGDAHDVRLPEIDGVSVVIGLRAKGGARTDASGFVVKVADLHGEATRSFLPFPIA